MSIKCLQYVGLAFEPSLYFLCLVNFFFVGMVCFGSSSMVKKLMVTKIPGKAILLSLIKTSNRFKDTLIYSVEYSIKE